MIAFAKFIIAFAGSASALQIGGKTEEKTEVDELSQACKKTEVDELSQASKKYDGIIKRRISKRNKASKRTREQFDEFWVPLVNDVADESKYNVDLAFQQTITELQKVFERRFETGANLGTFCKKYAYKKLQPHKKTDVCEHQ